MYGLVVIVLILLGVNTMEAVERTDLRGDEMTNKLIHAAEKVLSKEEKALGAFLSAMHDCKLDGAKMREAMVNVLGLSVEAKQAVPCNYPDCKCPTESPCLQGRPVSEPAEQRTPQEQAHYLSGKIDGKIEAHYSEPAEQQGEPVAAKIRRFNQETGVVWEGIEEFSHANLPLHTNLYIHPARVKAEPLTEELYQELIYAVASKFPGESRHQTALRYIQQREISSLDVGTAGKAKPVQQEGE